MGNMTDEWPTEIALLVFAAMQGESWRGTVLYWTDPASSSLPTPEERDIHIRSRSSLGKLPEQHSLLHRLYRSYQLCDLRN